MRHRPAAVVLLALVLGLLPMAYASPIDPSVPTGFYDNGDFDDVVVLLVSSASAVEGAPRPAVAVHRHVVGVLPDAESRCVPCTALRASPPRAPPV